MKASSVVWGGTAIALGVATLFLALVGVSGGAPVVSTERARVSDQSLGQQLGYPPNQPDQPARNPIDNLLLLPVSSCGVVRLARHEPVPQPFAGCVAKALRDSKARQLVVVRPGSNGSTTFYLRSFRDTSGLAIWTAAMSGHERPTWTVRRCPEATAVDALGRCRDVPFVATTAAP